MVNTDFSVSLELKIIVLVSWKKVIRWVEVKDIVYITFKINQKLLNVIFNFQITKKTEARLGNLIMSTIILSKL